MSTTNSASTSTSERKIPLEHTFNGIKLSTLKVFMTNFGVKLFTAQTISRLTDLHQWNDALIPRLKKAELVDDFDWFSIYNTTDLEKELQTHML
jgi:hypothetical protein